MKTNVPHNRKLTKRSSIVLLLSLTLVLSAFVTKSRNPDNGTAGKIQWMTFQEAVKLNSGKAKKKKIIIDFYTDWCGWCKRMDANTFTVKEVVDYATQNFHAVKFNAEQKDSFAFRGHMFRHLETNGGRGIHEFAYEVLQRRPSYPSIVFFDEDHNLISIAPGYMDATQMRSMMTWIATDSYKSVSFDDFHAQFLKDNNIATPPPPTSDK